ncbi:MAG TPA: hypothetical protein VG165_00030 [Solirubrobacteraceae bacterium]|jgi:hypothetical protein|nr:hypothetical protein [Solirubrobacteraceae bacterium]
MSHLTRRATPLVAMIVGSASLALAAAPAGAKTTTPAHAKTTTLHFFQKQTSQVVIGPGGKAIAPPSATNPPVVGEEFISTDDDYVGNHTHHAKTATASDHLVCTLTTVTGQATCDGEIAIGGSMLLAENVPLDLTKLPIVPLNGGTGIYKHAHGTASTVTVGTTNNSDFTVKFTT